jgi:hypothetical protein
MICKEGRPVWLAGVGRNREAQEVSSGDAGMQDLIYVAITLAFFVVSIAYVEFCDRIK